MTENSDTQPAPGTPEDVQLPAGSGASSPAETAPVAPELQAGAGEPQPPGPDGEPATTQEDLEAARQAEQEAGGSRPLEDAETPDPSADLNDVEPTRPNPYANPLGYVGKFAHGQMVTDSDAPEDQLDQDAGDQLQAGPSDQLDQQPPA